ncbi:group 1 glycosyl transferase [Hylemonella gracilis str. Niagara R]|uniref:Group 1 glycosyl transferase n=1 Tax=Hylemonella gracilis str. Niagara R TaxID=1458275 RepID=A0A016XFJ3_9BURK|nr:rhamnan synthesis F family protein [Hylemonella gracilis]EYC50347.1 group 1 glycosyl transferase [Hylemonella gracilis str. Niagara R]
MERLHRYLKHAIVVLKALRHYGISGPVLKKAWDVWRRQGLRRLLSHASALFSRSDAVFSSVRPFDPQKATILVVSHEASRTGAPVLSLNLVEEFSKRYNVVALLLGHGPLVEAFADVASELHIDPISRAQPEYAHRVINSICARHNLKAAFVNSIESRAALVPLALNFVPTISLMHEFASNTRPLDAFGRVFLWSSEVVFSTRLTMENALAAHRGAHYSSGFVHVLPQGRCTIPREEKRAQNLVDAERAFVASKMRPRGSADRSVVVLGVGTVQFRKGVDLFLECATRIAKEPGGENCRFVWFGHGYDPEVDLVYSVYLADQVQRAGLAQRVAIVRETSEIEEAYKNADIFLLSSRLDPLPNVAIDAMSLGVPVVCFDETTGIADVLARHGLRDACVADYLDTHDLARRVLALSISPAHRKSIGEKCREIARLNFQMSDYVARLEALMLAAGERKNKERMNVQSLVDSGALLPGFAAPAHIQPAHAAKQYVRAWESGYARRKPFPGFDPGVYRERAEPYAEEDPLLSFLKAGRPDGPWLFPVIGPDAGVAAPETKSTRVALHLHAYYADMLGQIAQRLECNQIRPDLFVSVKDEASRQIALDALRSYRGRVVDVRVVPNRGRDIGPLLTAFGDQLVRDYDIVGHLHTKKSFDIKDRQTVDAWYAFELENLLGGKVGGRMADTVIAYMADHTAVGIVFPDDPYVVGWSSNRACAEPLAKRVGLSSLPNEFNFPVGTMFWARTAVLKPFVALGLTWDDYPLEPLPYDGTMLHALERLFGLVPAAQGLCCAVTHVPGVTR